jgi:anti-sigma regulatory factor (Ser/Thr protein kinase)
MKELTVDAKTESFSAIKSFVGAELEAMDCPEGIRQQLFVVIDEIFANIVSYAFAGGEGSATVRLEAESEPRAAVLTFLDSGIPFDPLTMKTPDTSLKARERKIGGLGIFMVRKLMDEVSYAYADGKNILRTVKRF